MFVPVPKDVCPLDALADLGSITKNARIYIGKNAVEKLRKNAFRGFHRGEETLRWEATEKYPSTLLMITKVCEDFFKVTYISTTDIAFTTETHNPNVIIFVEMAE